MANTKINQQILNQLQKYFKIGWKDSKNIPNIDKIFPLRQTKDDTGKSSFSKEQFPDEIKRLFNWWMNDCHDSAKSWQERAKLFQDCDMICDNMGMMARAMEIMADETIQADSNMQPIFIEAKKKTKKVILDFFDKVGIYNILRSTALDIIKYGNAGWMLGFDHTGVNKIIPIEVYDIKERLEFSPIDIENKMKGNDNLFSQFQKHDRINALINSITNKENVSSFYDNYLFGFQINDNIVPPWRFIHFRNLTNRTPFKPFGAPIFVHSIAPYRQWDAAMTMQIVARGAKFPKEVYKLKVGNAADPATKLELAVEFLNELMNSGIGTSKKDLPGVNEIRITIDELFDWDMQVPNIDLGKIDDIQMLWDDLVNSTFMPRDWVDPNSSGFGKSGFSLTQEFKPFARLIFRIQNILLSNISQVIKIHMIHSQDFEEEEMDFVLSMPYPESQINPDIISSQTTQWALANEIITSLSDKLLGGDSLPTDVIKQIYQKVLPYDDQTIDRFIKDTLKARQENDVKDYENKISQNNQNSSEESIDASINAKKQDIENQKNQVDQEKINIDKIKNAKEKSKLDKEESFEKWRITENKRIIYKWKKLEEKIGKQKLQEKIESKIFQEKQEVLREGLFKHGHYFSSRNINIDFPAERLIELDKVRLKKLDEINSIKGDDGQEKYKFNESFYKEEIKVINEN